MANITESSTWEPEIFEVSIGDPVGGGPTAPVNQALQDLANRTLYLKDQYEDLLEDYQALKLLVGDVGMSAALLKSENLADLSDKAAARNNLDVSQSNHDHDAAYLKKASNLSDVANAAQARTNLGIQNIYSGTATPTGSLGKDGDIYIRQNELGTPTFFKRVNGTWSEIIPAQFPDRPGFVRAYAGSAVPSGYLECDGAAVSRATYASLFAAIGTVYGGGNGTTTFNLPDLRGQFVRGWDHGRGLDNGRAFGSAQDSDNKSHTHTLSASAQAAGDHGHSVSGSTAAAGSHSHSISATALSAGEHTHNSRGNCGGGLPGVDDSDGDNGNIWETSAAGAHTHTVTGSATSAGSHTHTLSGTAANAGTHGHTVTGTAQSSGSTESRPKNVALMYVIKY